MVVTTLLKCLRTMVRPGRRRCLDEKKCAKKLLIFGRRHLAAPPHQSFARLEEVGTDQAINLTIANGEEFRRQASGITGVPAEELFDMGALDVITTGKHISDKREISVFRNGGRESHKPGRRVYAQVFSSQDARMGDWTKHRSAGITYAVMNLQGRVFMSSNDGPFRQADELFKRPRPSRSCSTSTPKPLPRKIVRLVLGRPRKQPFLGTHTHIPPPTRYPCRKHGLPMWTRQTGPYDSVMA